MDPSRLVGYEKIPMNDSIYIREIVYTRSPPFLSVVVTTWPRWRYVIKGWMWDNRGKIQFKFHLNGTQDLNNSIVNCLYIRNTSLYQFIDD